MASVTIDSNTQRRQLKFLVLGAAGAGKTSLLRRYFYNQFDQHRMPTLGSDFYWGKVQLNDSASEVSVNIQMWVSTIPSNDGINVEGRLTHERFFGAGILKDTPGKELRVFDLRKRRSQYTASFSDSFFQSANGIMLVYDMLSSTSFTRLLKWYADLVELFNRTSKKIPIIVVANKKDLWNIQYDQSSGRHPFVKTVPQRDVLGLSKKNYGGRDLRYEYSVATGGGAMEPVPDNGNHKNRDTDNSSAERSGRRRMEISSYLVNRDNWTSDCSYLESLLLSEDASQPDRDMVRSYRKVGTCWMQFRNFLTTKLSLFSLSKGCIVVSKK
jgi:GTPase SAR1 family protein